MKMIFNLPSTSQACLGEKTLVLRRGKRTWEVLRKIELFFYKMETLRLIQYVKNPLFYKITGDAKESVWELALGEIKYARFKIKIMNTKHKFYLSNGTESVEINEKIKIWFNAQNGVFICSEGVILDNFTIQVKINEFI